MLIVNFTNIFVQIWQAANPTKPFNVGKKSSISIAAVFALVI